MWLHNRLFGMVLGASILVAIAIVLFFGEDWGLWGSATENVPATGGNDWMMVPVQGGNDWLDVPISGGNNWADAALIIRYTLNSPNEKALFEVGEITQFDSQTGLLSLQILADSGNASLVDWLQNMQTNPTIQSYELTGLDKKGNLIAGWKIKNASIHTLSALPAPNETTLAYELTLKFNEIAMQ